jgi:hypothetical protein
VQVFYLNVPFGYELLWKDTFENEEIIRWASPNYYSDISNSFFRSKTSYFCSKPGGNLAGTLNLRKEQRYQIKTIVKVL